MKNFLNQSYFKIIQGVFIISFLHGVISAQPEPLDALNGNISDMLPPLESLIDSALQHDPKIRFKDLQIIVSQNNLKAQQSNWLRNIGIQGDLRYGTFNVFSTNTSEGQNPDVYATQENEFNYGVGAYIKFPIFDIFSRKYQLNLANTEIEQAIVQTEIQKQEVRQMIIIQYNDLILKHNILKIKGKYQVLMKSNIVFVEKEFQNGKIDLTEFTRISGLQTDAETDFETARIDFITAYLILEELVGFKLNLGINF